MNTAARDSEGTSTSLTPDKTVWTFFTASLSCITNVLMYGRIFVCGEQLYMHAIDKSRGENAPSGKRENSNKPNIWCMARKWCKKKFIFLQRFLKNYIEKSSSQNKLLFFWGDLDFAGICDTRETSYLLRSCIVRERFDVHFHTNVVQINDGHHQKPHVRKYPL